LVGKLASWLLFLVGTLVEKILGKTMFFPDE
jgi:hypothetical protein